MDEQPELRPLPIPPHCRGILLPDGNYTGCVYGYGDLTPLTGPCDCPVCHGTGFEGVIGTTLPHSSFGDPDCCGCLNGIIRGDRADIECNECEAILRTVSAADLQRTFDEMELTLDVSAAICSHCGAGNLFPGFTTIMAFTCKECGRINKLSDDRNVERFFR